MSAVVPDREHIENLKKSYEQIGPLQNVIVDEYDGKVLVGKHRKFALVDWPEKKINSEGDPLIRELIPIHGNVHRRVSEEETRMRFVRVARILEESRKYDELERALHREIMETTKVKSLAQKKRSS